MRPKAKKVYIAAPIFNAAQLQVVNRITMMLKLLEFDYFSPYEASRDIWKGRAPKDCSEEERKEVLNGNIDNLHTSDILLAWIGGTENGKTDTGVVWEMGYYNAISDYRRFLNNESDAVRLPNALTMAYVDPTDKRQSMNLMLAGTVDAIVYGPAQLQRALETLRRHGPVEDEVRRVYNPEKGVLHEVEAVG